MFVVLDDVGAASERGGLGGKLRSFHRRCTASTNGGVRDASFVLLPTFNRPHFTIVLPALESVSDLAIALGPLLANPYAGG